MPGSIGSETQQPSMAETERAATGLPLFNMNEDIVISGISGRFPKAKNMDEFAENLMNNVDVYQSKEKRWGKVAEVPDQMPIVDDGDKFDADFFLSNPRFSDCTDPYTRMVLESTYEAIVDAGESIESMWDTKTGVFSASGGVDVANGTDNLDPYVFQVNTASFVPNRIAYIFNLNGTSFIVNGFTTGSLAAIDQAILEMRHGYIDQAIVTGHSLAMEPFQTVAGRVHGIASPDGRSRSFDAQANGVGRGEDAVVILLQKRSQAKRIYATVAHCKGLDTGFNPEGILQPSAEAQQTLMKEVYEEVGIDPLKVNYVESMGSGVPDFDVAEAKAIGSVMGQGRKEPLLLGSVTSNIGLCDSGAGLASIAKVLVAMETGRLPPNALYTTPNPRIPDLVQGRLKVVDKVTTWQSDIAAVNSYSFGGALYHCCLKADPNTKRPQHAAASEPRLFTYNGRTADGVKKVLEQARKNAQSVEWQALLQNSCNSSTEKLPFRGFTILNHSRKVERVGEKCSPDKRPVWFAFCGVGSQWPKMARAMFRFEIFRTAIKKCSDALTRYDLDLYDIFLNGDDKAFSTPTMTFIGITSVQIALVDLVRSLGIEPDGILGHSVGEIGCGYADGCITAEEAMLNSYWRGNSFKYVDFPKGAMAAVELTWEEVKETIPEGVYAACHNSINSVTISGRPEAVKNFSEQLKAKGVTVRGVSSNDVAFHSPDTRPLVPVIHRELKGLVERRKRTSRWVSSSIPESKWQDENSQYCGMEYFTTNLTSPVLFYEAATKIPKNAIVIEFGPHGPLQGLLKNTIGPEGTVVSLMKRGHEDNVEHFFSNLGVAYSAGLNLLPLGMYPPVQFPVPRGTPMVSPAVSAIWDHSASFAMHKNTYLNWDNTFKAYRFDLSKDDLAYLADHRLAGTVLFPASGLFVITWHALARSLGKNPEEVPVMLSDVKIHAATAMPSEGEVSFNVRLQSGTGQFEIWEGDNLVTSGRVHSHAHPDCPVISLDKFPEEELDEEEVNVLDQSEIYRSTMVRGFDYGPTFRKLLRSSTTGNMHEIEWDGRWIAFIDSALVGSGLGSSALGFSIPVSIDKISIDPLVHPPAPDGEDEETEILDLFVDQDLGIAHTGGLTFQGLHVERTEASVPHDHFMSDELKFVPFEFDLRPQLAPVVTSYAQECTQMAVAGFEKLLQEGKLKNRDVIESILKNSQIKGQMSDQLVAKYGATAKTTVAQYLQEKFLVNSDQGKISLSDLKSDMVNQTMIGTDALAGLLNGALSEMLDFKMVFVELDPSVCELFKPGRESIKSNFRMEYSWNGLESIQITDAVKSGCTKSLQWSIDEPLPDEFSGKANVVIAANYLHRQKDLKAALTKVKDMLLPHIGQIIVMEPTSNFPLAAAIEGLDMVEPPVFTDHREFGPYLSEDSWRKLFAEAGLEIIYHTRDHVLNSIFLLKKSFTAVTALTHYVDITSKDPSWVDEAKEKVQEVLDSPDDNARIWFYSQEYCNGLRGFIYAMCIDAVEKGYRIRGVSVGNLETNLPVPKLTPGCPEFEFARRRDMNHSLYVDGQWGTYLLVTRDPYKNKLRHSSKRAFLSPAKPGEISSLRFHSELFRHNDTEDTDGEHWASVIYSAVSSIDRQIVTGQLPGKTIRDRAMPEESGIGLEFLARHPISGRRIMGAVSQRGIAPEVDLRHAHYCDVPETMSSLDAAGIFLPYTVALYALIMKGDIRQGDRILVHSAAGPVGEAAVRISLHHGLDVYVTVSSEDKRRGFKSKFPEIPDSHISSARTANFVKEFLVATDGQGMDVILNTLDNIRLHENIALLQNGGRFLELGRKNVVTDSKLELSLFEKNIDFHVIDFIYLLDDPDSKEIVAELISLLQQGLKDGYIKPYESVVFGHESVMEAFRYLEQNKPQQRVLIQFREDDPTMAKLPRVAVNASMRLMFEPHKSYLLVGGLGGLGMEIAEFLVERGARKLVLTARSGITTAYQNWKLRRWSKLGVVSKIYEGSCSTEEGARAAIEMALTLGPLGGLINFAGLIRDGEFSGQTVEQFQDVMAPKVYTILHLDKLTRELCGDSVDWFVAISSQTAGRGNGEQTNYGLANAWMERIVEKRRAAGYRGCTSVEYGAIGDVGILLRSTDNNTIMNNSRLQRILSCKEAFEYILLKDKPVLNSGVPAGDLIEEGSETGRITAAIFRIFGVKDVSSLEPETKLSELGMDSIQSVQIKRMLDKNFKLEMTNKDIGALTVAAIQALDNAE